MYPSVGHDYSDDRYRVYMEIGETGGEGLALLADFLMQRDRESDHAFKFDEAVVSRCGDGYELRIPTQLIPEVVRALAAHNIAVYQVIRGARI